MKKDIQEKLKNMPELLTIGQVAEIFSIHPDTLRNWEKEGILVPLRAGKRGDRKYRPQDIEIIVDKMGSQLTLPQLEAFLWRSADILRGKIDSSDYKKYIFGLLFYKRISDVWDEEYKKVMEEYKDEEIAKADYNHRFQVPKDCRWEVITQQAENIGQKLNEIFEKLANANSPKLDKIFDDLDFANKDRFPNETLQRLVNHFSQYNFGSNYISSDLLGDAYEYLIKQFAADAGKKGGEFYTPREVEKVIIGILKPHQKDHIYDPTVGSGGFLLEAYDYLKQKSGEKIAKTLYLYGQELNIGTFAIAKINMFLHGLDSADIRRGDTLANPQFLNSQGALQTFDIVVANPPYSIKDWEYEIFKTNKFGRLEGYDLPPEKNADFAFVLHIIKSMNVNGKAGVVLPHGVLTRGGAEARIREQIVRNDLIEAIVALPPKLFYGTVNPAAVLIFNKNKSDERKGKILLIDAEKEFLEGKNQNTLRQQDIEKIIGAFDGFQDMDNFSKVVDVKEIEEKEFNLNIRQYIASPDEEAEVNIEEVLADIKKLKSQIAGKNIEGKNDFDFNPKNYRKVLINDIAIVSTGGTPSTQKKEYWNGDIPWMSSGEVNQRHVRKTEKMITQAGLDNCNSDIYPSGTVMIALAGQGSTRGKVAILEIASACNQSLAALRVKDENVILSSYLFYNLEHRYLELRNINGNAGRAGLNLKLIKNLPLIIPPIAEQKRIVELFTIADREAEAASELKERLGEYKKGLMQKILKNN